MAQQIQTMLDIPSSVHVHFMQYIYGSISLYPKKIQTRLKRS